MAAKKKATPGRKRGRPRKSSAPASSSSSPAPAASSPASSSSSVDQLILGATSAPAPDTDAALEALAAAVASEPPARGVVLTGEIHDPGASSSSPSDVAQLSQQIAALAVVLFGVLALWRGDEWALEEDEAELIGDATAEPYAGEAAELMQKVKWLGPATALVGIVGRKFMAESERRRKEAPPRAPGTAPAGQ